MCLHMHEGNKLSEGGEKSHDMKSTTTGWHAYLLPDRGLDDKWPNKDAYNVVDHDGTVSVLSTNGKKMTE